MYVCVRVCIFDCVLKMKLVAYFLFPFLFKCFLLFKSIELKETISFIGATREEHDTFSNVIAPHKIR